MPQTLVLRSDLNISTQFLLFALFVLAHLNAAFNSLPSPLSCHKFLYLSLPARQSLLSEYRCLECPCACKWETIQGPLFLLQQRTWWLLVLVCYHLLPYSCFSRRRSKNAGSRIDDEEKTRGGVFAPALGETSQYAGAVYKNTSEGSPGFECPGCNMTGGHNANGL